MLVLRYFSMQILKAALSRVTAVCCCCWWASGVWLLPLLVGFLKFFPLTFPPWNGNGRNKITEFFWEYTMSDWAIFLWEQFQVFLRMSVCVICDTNSTAFCPSQKLWSQAAKWKCFGSILTSSGVYHHWCWQYQLVKWVCVTRQEPALESSWSSSELQLSPAWAICVAHRMLTGSRSTGLRGGDSPGLRCWTWMLTVTLPWASADCHLYTPNHCLCRAWWGGAEDQLWELHFSIGVFCG